MSISGVEKEINKFLKKIKTTGSKERVELHNIVGGLYTDIGLFDEARNHHEKALEICKELGDGMGVAIAYRHIGEAKASCGLFDEANEDVHRYLELSQKCNNQIEVQRALTTLGRVQLMQAQQMKDESYYHSEIKRVALRAEKTFHKALNLTQAIKRQVDPKEFDQMYAGLLVNMGLVKELCGKRSASIETLCEARELYKTARLKEELFRCLVLLTSINRQAKEMGKASQYSKEALDVAKSVGKKLLICEAFMEVGLVHITLKQFKEAKRAFRLADREGSPNEEDQEKAVRYRRIAQLISDTFNKLEEKSLTSVIRSQCAERLGDLFVKLDCYSQAVVYYALALEQARISQKPKPELAKILFSLAETYFDDGQLAKALKCFEKELTWSRDEKAKCQTMLRLAQVRDQLDHDQVEVCEAYEKALKASDKFITLKQSILDNYIPFLKEKHCNAVRYRELVKMKQNIDDCCEEEVEVEADESELEEEIANLNVDEFVSEDDEDDEVLMLNRRRATKKFKTNEFGETPLHEAIIRGDIRRVKLLLQAGHDVNPRDNLGWTPLHEACNFGHYEIAQMLIEKGADVSSYGPKGMTPLHDAASNGHFDVMRLLMKNKANVVALTSKGESVLRCLRDYRRRHEGKMSNAEMSDYKEAEVDLLDLMDKCGFDLMSANKTAADDEQQPNQDESHAIRSPIASTSSGSIQRPRPKQKSTLILPDVETEIVRDYRATLGHLKRKQRSPEPEPTENKRPNPEVTYEPEFDPSAPTKQWLIDDVSKAARRKPIRHALESDEEFDDDDDEDMNSAADILKSRWSESHCVTKESSRHVRSPSISPQPLATKPINNMNEIVTLDDDEDHLSMNPNLASPRLPESHLNDAPSLRLDSRSRSPSLWSSNYHNDYSENDYQQYASNRTKDKTHIYAHIDNNKLLIQIPDSKTSIKWLKDAIIDRYEALVGDRPCISIAPIDDPECMVSDKDTCQLFLGDHVIARVLSWNLKPPQDCYAINCNQKNPSLEPSISIERELTNLGSSQKLDFSYMRLPNNHIEPVCQALARRPYTCVKLNGTTCLFRNNFSDLIINSIYSWVQLVNLELRCVGLLRSHFEALCSKLALINLKIIDLSYNCITYKSNDEFKCDLEKLVKNNPALKRLDLSHNQLKFIGALLQDKSDNDNLTDRIGLSKSRDNEFVLIADQQNDQYTVARVCSY